MSLYLLKATSDKVKTDPDNKTSADPTSWTAQYQVDYSVSTDLVRGGRCFWFEVDIEKSRHDAYQAKVTMHAPSQLTMRAALLKLAEWARMLAAGIEECDLPDEGFPVEIKRRAAVPSIVVGDVGVEA